MKYDFSKKRGLILAPHGDDGELGSGGSIARLIEEGVEIFYMCFSMCEESIPDGFPKNALEIEVKRATKSLGINPNNLILNHYPVRKLNEHRQEILEQLVKFREKVSPDIIFMPSSFSLHQDHKVIYEEGVRAFKHKTCFGYDLPWDVLEFKTTSFFKLEKRHIEEKSKSLKIYETQKHREYCDTSFVFSLAEIRGAQIGVPYAEAFEMIRIIF
jgi:N-acetylglucosamine malate deacetylase 1